VPADTTPASPSFAKPPLEEVALAIQFQPQALDLLTAAAFGQAIADDFPHQEERPAQPRMAEEFGVAPPIPFRFEVIGSAPQSRLWLLSENRARLVQLQHDLVAYNWRRTPEGVAIDETYPRYSKLRSEFEQRLALLAKTVEARGRESLRPDWCEVTYINHVAPLASSDRPRLDQLLRGVSVPQSAGFLPDPEDVGLNLRFVIPGESDTPRGRLNVALNTARRTSDLAPVWVMTLTARILDMKQESVAAALKTLDIGHTWVVNSFTELTSDQMHEVWERRDETEGSGTTTDGSS
jgi:uncharacterized protein (TIGR04255 family)